MDDVSVAELMDVKRNAQHVKIKKPSRPELYQDATRILEELLTKRLEDQLPHHPHHRRRTAPLPSQVGQAPVHIICERDTSEVRRAHTLPSDSRQLINQGLKQKDVNTLGRRTSDAQHSGDAGSISSADTEGDSSSVTDKRRKKTLFRKAKDRLLHAFHRQARERDADLKDEDRGDKSRAKGISLKTASPKHKGNEKKSLVESVVRRLSTKKDNSDGSQSVKSEEKNGSQLPQTEINRPKNSAGKGFMKSIRRSLKVSDKKEKVCPPEGSSVDGSSKTATSQGSPDSLPPYSPQSVAQSNSTAAHGQRAGGLAVRHDQGLSVSPGRNSPSPFPQSTSTDSYHDSGNKSSSLHSFASAHGDSSTSAKNVLDDPGEDIQFMDDDGRIRSRHTSGNDKRLSTIFFQIPPPIVTVDSGYSNNGTTSPIHPPPPPPPPPPPTGGSAELQRCVSLQEDGDTSDGAGLHAWMDGASGDVPFHKKSPEEKEKLYAKIAQKLITIADAFSADTALSDSEARHKTGHQEAAVGPADLESLEMELIECLRGKGDELSHKIDGPAEKLVEQTKAKTYERFEKTIQHSLGNEVSWNHLAFLFYTTRGVVKAVGVGSDVATEVTEMTLRYFSDKLASWIIDQGGFETLAESDSELD